MMFKFLVVVLLGLSIVADAETTLRLEVFSLQSAIGEIGPPLSADNPEASMTVPANAKRIWQRDYSISKTPLAIKEIFKGLDKDNVGITFEVRCSDLPICFIKNYTLAASAHENVALLESTEAASGLGFDVFEDTPIVLETSVQRDQIITHYYFDLSSRSK
jgi:hypothetical protein